MSGAFDVRLGICKWLIGTLRLTPVPNLLPDMPETELGR